MHNRRLLSETFCPICEPSLAKLQKFHTRRFKLVKYFKQEASGGLIKPGKRTHWARDPPVNGPIGPAKCTIAVIPFRNFRKKKSFILRADIFLRRSICPHRKPESDRCSIAISYSYKSQSNRCNHMYMVNCTRFIAANIIVSDWLLVPSFSQSASML